MHAQRKLIYDSQANSTANYIIYSSLGKRENARVWIIERFPLWLRFLDCKTWLVFFKSWKKCKLQIENLINICKCQSIFIFLPYFQLAPNIKTWENKPMHCVNENISCSPQNRSWKMLHRFRTCYIVGWNPFWRRFLTFFSLYCWKIFINHNTMRRNLLNWCNNVLCMWGSKNLADLLQKKSWWKTPN